MYIIGLTGNIATGKSTVARLLHDLGAEVIDADREAHAVMAPGTAVWETVCRTFGREILGAEGAIDRRKLGSIVFADPSALARLEAIVHPAVGEALRQRLHDLRQRREPPGRVVIEAIKLIEAGLPALCDAVWIVTAPRPVQIRRLVEMRHLTAEEAALRIDAQPPIAPKLAQADVRIENDGSLVDLKRQVHLAWKGIPRDGEEQNR